MTNYTLLSEKIVTTRKPHRCWGCWKSFRKGSQLLAQTTASSDGIGTSYTCQDCHCWIDENTGDWTIADWEGTLSETIGYWKGGRWFPQYGG